jgi:pimeloyl-ACP methyl ester carboxylesterase
VLILHGANGSRETMRPLVNPLRTYARIETPNLIGHGGRPVPPQFSVRECADDIVAYLDERNIARTFVCGYSFGGYIALYLARHFRERVRAVCTLATKYVFDEPTVRRFTYLANPERLNQPGNPVPAQQTAMHYPESWVAVMTQNARLFADLGTNPAITDEDMRAVSVPVLLVSSDQDQLVPAAETVALSRLLPDSRVVMFHGKAHPLEVVPCEAIARVIGDWMAQVLADRTPDLAGS